MSEDWKQLSVVTCISMCQKQAIHSMVQTCGEDTRKDRPSMTELLSCDDSAVPDEYKCPKLWPGNPHLPGLLAGDWRTI